MSVARMWGWMSTRVREANCWNVAGDLLPGIWTTDCEKILG